MHVPIVHMTWNLLWLRNVRILMFVGGRFLIQMVHMLNLKPNCCSSSTMANRCCRANEHPISNIVWESLRSYSFDVSSFQTWNIKNSWRSGDQYKKSDKYIDMVIVGAFYRGHDTLAKNRTLCSLKPTTTCIFGFGFAWMDKIIIDINMILILERHEMKRKYQVFSANTF